jgi:hypothetical protein
MPRIEVVQEIAVSNAQILEQIDRINTSLRVMIEMLDKHPAFARQLPVEHLQHARFLIEVGDSVHGEFVAHAALLNTRLPELQMGLSRLRSALDRAEGD